MSSSSTTTTTKNVADAKIKATPNAGGYTVKISTSAQVKLQTQKMWKADVAKSSHRKVLAKVVKEHEVWMEGLSQHHGIMEEKMKPVVLYVLMTFMENFDQWWLSPTCFDIKGDYIPSDSDDLTSLLDDLQSEGVGIADGDELAVLLYELDLYRDDMCGAVDSRKVLQAAVEWIEAGKADDAMVQLYNNLTGYANDHDFPDTELGEALNDPTQHRGVKLPVVKTSNGLLWCDIPDALPMVVLYQGKRYDAGPFKMSQLPLDVLEDQVGDTGKPLKRSASSNLDGASMPALKRSKSVVSDGKQDTDKIFDRLNVSMLRSETSRHYAYILQPGETTDVVNGDYRPFVSMHNGLAGAGIPEDSNSDLAKTIREEALLNTPEGCPLIVVEKTVCHRIEPKILQKGSISNGASMPALKRSKSVVQKETKPKQTNQFNQTTMSSSELGKLPPITDGLTRLLETPEPNGIHFIITDCAKGGFVFGNHTIEYQYDTEEFATRCGRVANGEGEVLYGTVTLEDGKLRAPITEDALISFGKEEPIFPIGHYINIIKDQGGSIQPIE